MTETIFCYCCRVHHPRHQMRLFATARGERWRCLRSIEAAHGPRQARDAFGRRQTDINRKANIAEAERKARLYPAPERP